MKKDLKESDLVTPTNTKVVWAMFAAKAYVEAVRAVIEPKQIEVLEFYQFPISAEVKKVYDNRNITDYPSVILHPKYLYLMSADDVKLYCEEMKKFHQEKGFKLDNPDHCPLLVAESLQREVNRHAVDFFEPYFGLNSDKLLCAGLDEFKKFIELLMSIFAPAVQEYNEKNPLVFNPTQKPDFL